MNIGRAVGIVKNISSENVTGNVTNEEVALAIYDVMNMPTLNSVSKYELVKVMQWLWHQAFRFEDEEGADNGNEQNAEIEDYSHNNRGMTRDIRELQKALEQAKAEIERLKLEKADVESDLRVVLDNSVSAKYPHCVLCGNGAILTKSLDEYDKLIADISAEAIKEFAERLKEERYIIPYGMPPKDRIVVFEDDIDNLLKEMVGDDG